MPRWLQSAAASEATSRAAASSSTSRERTGNPLRHVASSPSTVPEYIDVYQHAPRNNRANPDDVARAMATFENDAQENVYATTNASRQHRTQQQSVAAETIAQFRLAEEERYTNPFAGIAPESVDELLNCVEIRKTWLTLRPLALLYAHNPERARIMPISRFDRHMSELGYSRSTQLSGHTTVGAIVEFSYNVTVLTDITEGAAQGLEVLQTRVRLCIAPQDAPDTRASATQVLLRTQTLVQFVSFVFVLPSSNLRMR